MSSGESFYDIQLLLGSHLEVQQNDGMVLLYKNSYQGRPRFEQVERFSDQPKVNYVGAKATGFVSVIEESLFNYMQKREVCRGREENLAKAKLVKSLPTTPQDISGVSVILKVKGPENVLFAKEVSEDEELDIG